MPLPADDPALAPAKRPLLEYAIELFPGLGLGDPDAQIQVFRTMEDSRAELRFLDWSVTGRQAGTFLGFEMPAPPHEPRSMTVRVFTVATLAPIEERLGPERQPESQWDQVTLLAQLGVRAVGRPVAGPLHVTPVPR